MSNKPNVDEQIKTIISNAMGLLKTVDGKGIMRADSARSLLQMDIEDLIQAEIAQAKQQTCDDIVGLVPEQKQHIESDRNIAYREGHNDCRTQTIAAINKYKGEI